MRKVITEKSGIPENMQRLIYKAKLLKDEDLLSAFVNEDGETLHLIRKPTEAERQTAQAPPQEA